MFKHSKGLLVQVASIAILSAGFAQFSWAGAIDTNYMIEADARAASLDRIEVLLTREDVARQLHTLGVELSAIDERLQGMTLGELAALEGQIDQQIAGSGALGTIGAVFLVLLILELVGVTDIFKSF